ncbi:Beta-hexosaminidase, partial [Exaiptasia diaphana]
YDLPLVANSETQIDAIDFPPFRSGIRAGSASVMIGHLNVPSLDSTGTPSSLSPIVIRDYLQGELGFKGLVISDALNMKAVADRYGKTDVVVKAFQAGCDIVLFPESVTEAIKAIEEKVNAGEITQEEIDQRCRKILKAKYKAIVAPKDYKAYDKYELELAKKQVYEKAITVVKNDGILPIQRFDQRIAHVSIGSHTYPLDKSMKLVAPVDHFHFYTVEEARNRFSEKLKDYDLIITSFHSNTVRSRNDYGMPKGWKEWISDIPTEAKQVLLMFANPQAIRALDTRRPNAIVMGYENHSLVLDRMGQFVMGTFASSGKLPMTIPGKYASGHGLEVEWGGRLKESQPEELGI